MRVLVSIVGLRSEHWLGLFRALSAKPDLELYVLAADITSDTVERLHELERNSDRVHFLHAQRNLGERLTGHMASIVYDRHAHKLWPERLDAIHVIGEAGYPTTFQVLRLRNRMFPTVPLIVYAAQNVLQRFPWPFRSFERSAFRHATTFVPVSADAERVLRAKGYRGPARVIPLGVDTEQFVARSRPPAGPFTVGFVGRLAPHKGVILLPEVAARLDCRLLFVGDGPLRPALHRSVLERNLAGRVEFAGWISHDELPRQLHRMHVLVLPSIEVVQRNVVPWIGVRLREQFGRVLCEAMSCGVPVVGSDLGEIPRVIGPAGLTFPRGDVDAVIGALTAIASDHELAARLGEAGARRARELYSWAAIADSYVETWTEASVNASAPGDDARDAHGLRAGSRAGVEL